MLDSFDEGQIEINGVAEARTAMARGELEKTFAGVCISGEGAGGDDTVSEIANGTALKLTLRTGFSFRLALAHSSVTTPKPVSDASVAMTRGLTRQRVWKRQSGRRQMDTNRSITISKSAFVGVHCGEWRTTNCENAQEASRRN